MEMYEKVFSSDEEKRNETKKKAMRVLGTLYHIIIINKNNNPQ